MASTIGDIIDKLNEYVEVKAEQIKLMAIARLSGIISVSIALFIVLIVGFFFLFFLTFAIATIFNDVLGSAYLGYLLVAGVYFLFIIMVLILIKKGVIQSWIDSLILNIPPEEDEEDI